MKRLERPSHRRDGPKRNHRRCRGCDGASREFVNVRTPRGTCCAHGDAVGVASAMPAAPENTVTAIRPSPVNVAKGDLVDLRRPIQATRRPDNATVADRVQGPQLAQVQGLPRCRLTEIEAWPPLLRILSHELRGSLHGICGWVALAESGALPSDRIPRALRIIRRNVEGLSDLVETL